MMWVVGFFLLYFVYHSTKGGGAQVGEKDGAATVRGTCEMNGNVVK